jgi:colanic acid biosynthesis glycosyl transferase WcaI
MSAGLPNIKFIPLQPLERLNDLLNMADVHLLPQRSDAEDLVMPSKLSNMMASGKPVITTAKNGTQIEILVRECGIVVEPGDVEGFVNAVELLARNVKMREKLGDRGREMALELWDKNNVLSAAFAGFLATGNSPAA